MLGNSQGGHMSDNTPVEVIELSVDPVQKKLLGPDGVPIRVDLGDHDISRKVDWLLQAHRRRPHKTFLLRWEGNRIPYGAVVNGHSIGWTQHGIVNSNEGLMVGVYDRLKDEHNQIMLVEIFTDI
jgi:hypothetical protein